MSGWVETYARHSSGIEPYDSMTHLPAHAASIGGETHTPTVIEPEKPVTSQEPKVPIYKRRWFIICQIVTAIIGIAMIFVLLWPVVHAIAQHVLDVSHMVIESSMIEFPTNDTFTLKMQGYVTNTGIIPAKIHWTQPVRVSWMRDYGLDNETEVPIGDMWLESLVAENKRAQINQTTTFNISDQSAFGEFARAMITQEQFTWRLASDHLKVNAAKFPQAKNLRFRKDLQLKGINSFAGGIVLQDFSLPGEGTSGGIKFSTTTTLTNPSPFTIDLGTIVFNLKYQGVHLGQGSSTGVVVQPGENNVTLTGIMVHHTDSSDLLQIGKLFTAYLNGESSPVIAQGVSTVQSDGRRISWLSDGISALSLEVPLKSPSPINSIQSIEIGHLNLRFTDETAWAPKTSTDDLQATLMLPFGFGMDVANISNSFSIVQNDVTVGSLSSPLSSASSDIHVLGPSLTKGTIDITLAESPLQVPSNARQEFSMFNAELTQNQRSTFRLVGSAKTIAELPIGIVTLDPIKFNVTSTLDGLQGLNGYTWIDGVDVIGGTTEYLELAINVTIYNPSSLDFRSGDLTLQLYMGTALLGTALMPQLHLARGNNSIQATSQFRANDTPEGLQTLSHFLASQDTALTIKGYDGSSTIESLLPAFKTMNIDVSLPGLDSKLLNSAKLIVLPTTGRVNNIAHTTVNLNDPFTSGFSIMSVKSNVQAHGISLGSIQQDTNFAVSGHSSADSPNLDFNLNLDPPSMFTLVRLLAVEAGLGTEQLDGIVELGGYHYIQPVTARDIVPRNIYTGFDLPSYVNQAFSVLKADISLQSQVIIGHYQTTLNYAQTGVPIETDETLNLLFSVLAQPIVQRIVDGSVMGIDTLVISNPQERTFDTALKGSITQAGPFDAVISFPEGLSIHWNGNLLGTLEMPDIQLTGDVGASLDTSASFSVADVDQLAAFSVAMIQEESFEWDIHGQNLMVTAMGVAVPGVSMTKKVTLKGMNGLKDAVTINTFDLPSDDPAGGITLTLETTINNPSQVGIQLESLNFGSYYSTGTYLGPVSSVPQTSMAPLGYSQINFTGRMVPQTTDAGLNDLSTIFTNFIHDISSDVVVQGISATPDVSWLTAGIKTLRIGSVLPSRGILDIITGISIHQISMDFPAGSAYSPMSSSSNTAASFMLPFGFTLNIVSLEQTINVAYQNTHMAVLALGTVSANTDVTSRTIYLSFENVPFAVDDEQHSIFQQFLEATTTSSSVTFGLSGIASSEAETPIGRLSISGIAFDVSSQMAGINTFGGAASIRDVHITGSGGNDGNEYITSPLKTELSNPSNISLIAGSIKLPTYYQGVQVGDSVVNAFNLVPGKNTLDTEFRYHPANANDTVAQSFLQSFLEQSGNVAITINGDSQSAEFDSLTPALEQTHLGAGVPGIGTALVTHINVYVLLDTLFTNEVEVDFDVQNPLDCDLQLLHVQSDSGINGEIYAQFTWDFPNYVIPSGQTVNSGRIQHVVLTKGLLGSLPLTTSPTLDIQIAQTGRIGTHGYIVPWLKYAQDGIPVTVHLL